MWALFSVFESVCLSKEIMFYTGYSVEISDIRVHLVLSSLNIMVLSKATLFAVHLETSNTKCLPPLCHILSWFWTWNPLRNIICKLGLYFYSKN